MRLTAQVQYGDWKGTAKADDIDAHMNDLRKLLAQRGLSKHGEFLVGFIMTNAENTDPHKIEPAYIRAFFIPANDHAAAVAYIGASDPVSVREVALELPMNEFHALFKRFSVAMQWQGLDIQGRELESSD